MATSQTAKTAVQQANDGGQQPARQQQTMYQMLEQVKPQIERALPKAMTAERFTRIALTTIRQNPSLMRATPASLMGALLTAAQLGLEPGPLGHAYIVPYWSSEQGSYEAQFQLGYTGIIDLARRSEHIETITARAVYEADHFDVEYGLNERLEHKPQLDGDRGQLRFVYAYAKYVGGGHNFVVMSREDIEKVRETSQTGRKNKGPWRDWYEQMALKGLAVETPIPTPAGWSKMDEIAHGDRVFDMHGQVCRVTAVSETKEIDCYEVTCANGDRIVCDDEHYWLARVGPNGARDPWRPFAIRDLYEAKQRGEIVTLPVADAMDLDDAELPVDPWMLGYWLGNGAKNKARVTCHEDDLDHLCRKIEDAGYEVGATRPDGRGRAVDIGVRGLLVGLRQAAVLGAKHVPAPYLRGSTRQRRALLQGLIDSDGTVSKSRGRVHFVSTDKNLVDAVAELARSLGDVPNFHTRQQEGYGKTVLAHYVSWLPATPAVTVPRKAGNLRERSYSPYRGVRSIERVQTVPTRCIAVDSPTRSYLAGAGMIPTHNTAIKRLRAYLPLSVEMADAFAADEQRLTWSPDDGDVVDIPSETADPALNPGSDGEPEPEPDGGDDSPANDEQGGAPGNGGSDDAAPDGDGGESDPAEPDADTEAARQEQLGAAS